MSHSLVEAQGILDTENTKTPTSRHSLSTIIVTSLVPSPTLV